MRPQVVMQMSSNEAIKQAVMAGMGVALLSLHTVGLELDHHLIAAPETEGLPVMRRWHVVNNLAEDAVAGGRGVPLLRARDAARPSSPSTSHRARPPAASPGRCAERARRLPSTHQEPFFDPSAAAAMLSAAADSGLSARIRPVALTPFHVALQVRDLAEARRFYGDTLGCSEGRSAADWVDFNLYGHQLRVSPECPQLGPARAHRRTPQPVDGHGVPVPHCGVVLEPPQWHALAARLQHRRRVGHRALPRVSRASRASSPRSSFWILPGNALEFKAFADLDATVRPLTAAALRRAPPGRGGSRKGPRRPRSSPPSAAGAAGRAVPPPPLPRRHTTRAAGPVVRAPRAPPRGAHRLVVPLGRRRRERQPRAAHRRRVGEAGDGAQHVDALARRVPSAAPRTARSRRPWPPRRWPLARCRTAPTSRRRR